MKKTANRFFNRKKNKESYIRNQQEDQVFINRNNYRLSKMKNNKNKYIYMILSVIIILIIIISIQIIRRSGKKNEKKYYDIYLNNISYANSENTTIDSRYINMIPRLSPDQNIFPYSINDIFYARQIYINDAKITPDYVRYLRPINEAEEQKYKKRYEEGETKIDKNLFEKRNDQYDYVYFGKMALDEKLIDEKPIEYNNNPTISIVIPSYNKKNILLKSVRSIQNQNFKNIEIIIVNDCSTDNSTDVFNYLLKSDPRVRIVHHLTNLGCWRSRMNGILYSKGKYVILFDAGDLYEDNYVLIDALNVIEKYNLDSCKFLFRIIRSFNNIENSVIYFHVGNNPKIVYGPKNIEFENFRIFSTWGNIWNRLVRANIYTKALYLLDEMLLNLHKNVWDDVWYNKIVRRASYSYAIYERVGYVYLQDGRGEGSPMSRTDEEKSKIVKEYVGFLYYDYNFGLKNESIPFIVQKLQDYNERDNRLKLCNFRAHFEVLNNLLEALIKDPEVPEVNRTYCQKLLEESKNREKEVMSGTLH